MLEKFFDFVGKEKQIYQNWEKAGVFKMSKERDGKPVFNITMPPPNANGELHIGHCSGYAVMDILGRYHRMMGEQTFLLPGKDHAGIQTQVVFERKLREQGVDLDTLPREEFYSRCYDFCIDRAGYMREQEKLLGLSADFEREVFTLDPRVSEVIYETFEKLWEDGLVYRGSRIVHWSVYSQTSISDVEVEYKEEKGHLWHIKYPLLEAAKMPQRQRVKLSDLGVEILKNSGNHSIVLSSLESAGKLLDLKIGEAIVQVVKEDDVDIERDFVIYQCRKLKAGELTESDLEKYNEVLRGRMNVLGEFLLIDLVPELDQSDCIIVATTRPETMLGDTAIAVHSGDPRYRHLVGKKVKVPIIGREIAIIADDRIEIGFGTGAVKITPAHDFLDYDIGKDHKLEEIQVIDKFGKMTEAAGKQYEGLKTLECRELLVKKMDESGELLLTEEITHKVPIAERGKDIIEPLISKQWFLAVDKHGHSLKKRALELLNSGRINVYPARSKAMIAQWLENLKDWNISRQILWGHRMPVWYKNKDQANEEIMVGDQPSGDGWVQETDTFDTWFSSGQWPFSSLSTVGLLDLENPSESKSYPTHTMVMGRDILFFWACRMMILSTYRLDDIPWKNIYFTGLVRDAKGQKMSKSKGNGVEPVEILKKHGADALRIGLIAGSTAGLDPRFDEKKVESYAKFVNKIWNAAKLVEMKLAGDYQMALPELKLESSKWLLSELDKTKTEWKKLLDNYEFGRAFESIYSFSWDIFCSWYLEIAKVQLEIWDSNMEIKAVMANAFKEILMMLHPFMPFFTEEIFTNFGQFGENKMLAEMIFTENKQQFDKSAAENIEKMQKVVSAAREVRAVLEKGFNEKLVVQVEGEISEESQPLIEKIGNLELIKEGMQVALVKPDAGGNIFIQVTVKEKISFKANVEKMLAKKSAELATLQKILTPGFKAKADPDLIAEREIQFQSVSNEVEALNKEMAAN